VIQTEGMKPRAAVYLVVLDYLSGAGQDTQTDDTGGESSSLSGEQSWLQEGEPGATIDEPVAWEEFLAVAQEGADRLVTGEGTPETAEGTTGEPLQPQPRWGWAERATAALTVCADMMQHTSRVTRMDRAQACVLVARTCVSAGRFPEARAMLEGVRVIGSQAGGAEALGVWWRRALSLLVALYAQVRATLATRSPLRQRCCSRSRSSGLGGCVRWRGAVESPYTRPYCPIRCASAASRSYIQPISLEATAPTRLVGRKPLHAELREGVRVRIGWM
jgi:hypothetical protein